MKWAWRAYWGSVGLLLFGIRLYFNHRQYPAKSRAWKGFKAAVDSSLTCLMAAFCPALLIGYCGLWIARQFKGDGLSKTIVVTTASVVLGLVGGWFLEVLLIIGVFGSDLVTGKLLFDSPWKKHFRAAV